MVKDLRTGVETGNVDSVLDGELEEFVTAQLLGKKNPNRNAAAEKSAPAQGPLDPGEVHMSWLKRLFGRGTSNPAPPSSGDPAYQNPVDGKTYVAEGGWTEHRPQTPREVSASESVRIQEVRLLSAESDFVDNLDVKRLGGFIQGVEQQVKTHWGTGTQPAELLVQYTLHPDADPEPQIASRGETDQALLEKTQEALDALEPLRTRRCPVSFQVHFVRAKRA